jgi:4,5-DOPA dioxygenase extradiol
MAERMPALFIGHGNPMNALLVNSYTQRWAAIGATLAETERDPYLYPLIGI